MIASLRGKVQRQGPGELIIETGGVGYAVSVPIDVWEKIDDANETLLFVHSYIREDRFDLYGFLDVSTKKLFENVIALSGVGPKTGLEICAVPRSLLITAINQDDVKILTNVKGIGKKTAEKLLLDLKNLTEKDPLIFGTAVSDTENGSAASEIDQDTIDALRSLGYDTGTIMSALKNLPEDLESTEERVTAALRSL